MTGASDQVASNCYTGRGSAGCRRVPARSFTSLSQLMRSRASEPFHEPAHQSMPTEPARRLSGGPLAAIERLLRGGDRGYFDLFEQAGDNAAHAAELLERLLADFPEVGSLAQEIEACETAGDRATQEVMRRLNASFVTPIDREDIIRLGSTIDDIVDFIDEAAGICRVPSRGADGAGPGTGRRCSSTRRGHLARAIRLMSRLEDITRARRRGASPREPGRSDPSPCDRVAVRGAGSIRWS